MVKQSERVRSIVRERYFKPALASGQRSLSIRARDVLRDAEATPDFPKGRTPVVCNVLKSPKLLEGMGFEIDRIDGPPKLQSRNVVVHYRTITNTANLRVEPADTRLEGPAERALRLTEKFRGLLKDEIAAFGGADEFVRWVRSDEGLPDQ